MDKLLQDLQNEGKELDDKVEKVINDLSFWRNAAPGNDPVVRSLSKLLEAEKEYRHKLEAILGKIARI